MVTKNVRNLITELQHYKAERCFLQSISQCLNIDKCALFYLHTPGLCVLMAFLPSVFFEGFLEKHYSYFLFKT